MVEIILCILSSSWLWWFEISVLSPSRFISVCLPDRFLVCVCVCVMRKCLCYGDWWLICCARMECDQLRYEGALVNWPPGPRPPLPLRPGFFPPGPPRPGAPFGLQRPPMVTILSCASRLLTLLGCSTALDTSAGCCLLLLMSRGLCESVFMCVYRRHWWALQKQLNWLQCCLECGLGCAKESCITRRSPQERIFFGGDIRGHVKACWQ